MIKKCPHCGEPFVKKPSGAEYCSYKCYVYHCIKDRGMQNVMISRYNAHSILSLKSVDLKRGEYGENN